MALKRKQKFVQKAVSFFLCILMILAMTVGGGFQVIPVNAETTTKEASISFSGDEVTIKGFNDAFNWGVKFADNRATQNGVTGLKMEDELELVATDSDFLTSELVNATITIHYYEYGAYNPDNNEMYIRCSNTSNPFYGDSFGKISPPGELGVQTVTYTVDNALFNHNLFSESNDEFVRLLVNNLLLLRRKGLDFIACFADLNLIAYGGVILDYAVNGSNKFSVCSADIVSRVGCNDKLNALLGYVKSSVYFNHTDGNHCIVLSDGLGTYRRWNISYTHSATNRRIIPDVSAGSNVSDNPAAKRVPPEILQSLSGNQMVYKEGESNEIFLMCLR